MSAKLDKVVKPSWAAKVLTLNQAVLYLDGARTHLMCVTGCSEDEADHVAWRRWPDSMAADEADA